MFPQNTHFSELLTLVSTNKKHFPTQILSLARRLDLNSNQSKHSQFFPLVLIWTTWIFGTTLDPVARVTPRVWLECERSFTGDSCHECWHLEPMLAWRGKKKKQETTKEGKPNRCLCWRLGRSLNLVKPWRNILMENKCRTKQRVGKMGLHATFAKYASTCWSKTRYGNLSRVCGRLNAVTQV